MRKLRTGTPQPEGWEEADIMSYLNCNKQQVIDIMKKVRRPEGLSGYGAVLKEDVLSYLCEREREAREREARYLADLANAEMSATFKEQIKALQRLCDSSAEDARKARTQSLVANFISGISIAIAVLALVLKLY